MLYRAKDLSENVSHTFLQSIIREYWTCMDERQTLFDMYKTNMIITDSEKEQFKRATVCHICEQSFSKKDKGR